MMRKALGIAAAVFLFGPGFLAASEQPAPQTVEVPTMRTSIYIGSVTLSVGPLERVADTLDYSAAYQARVIPWWFWSETGTITLNPSKVDIARLFAGETIEVAGSATNHKGKPRSVSARIQPADDAGGTIKVRIDAGGTKLIFNGSYRFDLQGTHG